MPIKDYAATAKKLRLSAREIGRRANTSHVTVSRILKGSKEGISSKQTREKIYEVIRAEAKANTKKSKVSDISDKH